MVKVSEATMLQRLRRHLARDGQLLRKARSESVRHELGEWFAVDGNRNTVTASHIDPEAWAREAGILHGYEEVERDG